MASTSITTSSDTSSSSLPSQSTPPPPSTDPPPPPPSSTSSENPSSSSSSSSPSSSSSGSVSTSTTSTSTTSSSTSTSTPLSTPTPSTQSSSTLIQTSTSDGVVVTRTSISVVSPTLSPPSGSTNASSNKNNGFFNNKGAVAGVFTVVGLVVLALIIALIINIIRRRRAKRFDQETEDAAAEAAAAPAPIFLDDDDDDQPYRGNQHMYGGAGDPSGYTSAGQYSDASSHGTYGQPALSVGQGSGNEAYNMRELGPGPGEIFNPYGAVATGAASGAAGVGVARARSTRDPGAFANGLQDGAMPYPAFAGPGTYQQQQAYASNGPYPGQNYGGPDNDLLDAAGLGGVAATSNRGISLNHNQNSYSQQQSQPGNGAYFPNPYSPNAPNNQSGQVTQSDLLRSQSQARSADTTFSTTLTGGSGSPPPKEAYAAHYAGNQGIVHQEDADDAYGGYVIDGRQRGKGDEASSVYDDDVDERGPRVLKVANE